jgi:hypothetical protein
MLKTALPRAPRDVAKGRFSFEALGEVLFVRKADKGKKDKWMWQEKRPLRGLQEVHQLARALRERPGPETQLRGVRASSP